jgi:transposase-like protein
VEQVGPVFAAEICRKRVVRMRSYSDRKWYLDEVFAKVKRARHHLWRAVDHECEVRESFATKRRDRIVAMHRLTVFLSVQLSGAQRHWSCFCAMITLVAGQT